jgi:hypothetical protein
MDEVAAAPLHQRAIAMVMQGSNVLQAWPTSIFKIMICRNTSQYINGNEEVQVLGIIMEVYEADILLTSS